MPLSTSKVRRPESLLAMLSAGVEAIYTSGVDRVSVSQVSELSQHSRPTFYSYFGDVNGLLAEIWMKWGPAWLKRTADLDYELANDSLENQKLHLALTEIFAIARRTPELLEVVEPNVTDWWRDHEGDSELCKLRLLWLLGERIGSTIASSVEQGGLALQFIEAGLRMLPAQPSGSRVSAMPDLQLPQIGGDYSFDDEVELKLLEAAVDVIASTGVSSASIARIARRAQLTSGAVYPRFENFDDLLNATFEYSVYRMVSKDLPKDGAGMGMLIGNENGRQTWRNFRVEVHLEGRQRPALAEQIRKNLQSNSDDIAKQLRQQPNPDLFVESLPYLMHCLSIGFTTIQNSGLPIRSYNHELLIGELVNLLDTYFKEQPKP